MRLVVLVLAVVLAWPAGSPAATAPKKRKRCEVVVFKRAGKTVRRCRLGQRRPVGKAPVLPPAAPAPAPAAAPAPVGAPPAPETQTPRPAAVDPAPSPDAKPRERDPYFLTLYARDVGNGDFRLAPKIDDIPAGRLFLSYKNQDPSEHDLRLRGLEPETEPTVIFEAFSGDELKRTELTMRPGRYELFCSLPGHEQMRQPFTVTP